MAAKSRADLNTDADTALADNATRDISAEDVRQRVKDLADSAFNLTTDAITDVPGAGTAAASDTGDFATAAQGALADTALQTADIGVSVQAFSARLGEIAALAVTDSNFIVGNGSAWVVESGATVRTSLGLAIGSDVQAWSAVLDATTASFLIADETKLDGIEALADVTDAANVAAAGAVMDGDFSADGLMARTAAGVYASRTITGTADQITVANGDGGAGDPTLTIPALFKSGVPTYPVYETKTDTTANTTSGNADIVVASASNISVGDAIVASFATAPAWVTAIAGTTITMSANATATGTGTAVQFGYNRYSAVSTLFADTLAAKSGLFGHAASSGRSTFMAKSVQFVGNESNATLTPLIALGDTKTPAAILGHHTADNTTGKIYGLGQPILLDATALLGGTTKFRAWGQFMEMEAPSGAFDFHDSMELAEWDIKNNSGTDASQIDPYSGAVLPSMGGLHLESSGSNKVSVGLVFSRTSPSTWRTGILFNEAALDTTGGTTPAPALALAAYHGVTWYRATGQKAWDIYSTATTGNETLILSNGLATFSTPIVAENFRSVPTFTLGDDAATSFQLSDYGLSGNAIVLLKRQGTGASTGQGFFRVLLSGAAAPIALAMEVTNIEFTTGILSGTTGTDAKLTVSVHTDGKLYLENRLGSGQSLALTFF